MPSASSTTPRSRRGASRCRSRSGRRGAPAPRPGGPPPAGPAGGAEAAAVAAPARRQPPPPAPPQEPRGPKPPPARRSGRSGVASRHADLGDLEQRARAELFLGSVVEKRIRDQLDDVA